MTDNAPSQNHVDPDTPSRRGFLTGAAAMVAAGVVERLTPSLLAQAHEHARTAATAGPGALRFFTPAEAAEVLAVASQIIPTDDTPGAAESNVVYFIDLVLTKYDTDSQDTYRKGLATLATAAGEAVPGTRRFADLSSPKQIEVLRGIEKSEFFQVVRTHTVAAFFSDPRRGSNPEGRNWQLIGFDGAFFYQPPFGYYDDPKSGA
jgi:gluconate 2-dehydrogenase gamma chain